MLNIVLLKGLKMIFLNTVSDVQSCGTAFSLQLKDDLFGTESRPSDKIEVLLGVKWAIANTVEDYKHVNSLRKRGFTLDYLLHADHIEMITDPDTNTLIFFDSCLKFLNELKDLFQHILDNYKDPKAEFLKFSICTNVSLMDDIVPSLWGEIYRKSIDTWPRYTGNYWYPVASPRYSTMVHLAATAGFYEGAYGQNRLDLVRHMKGVVQQYTDKHEVEYSLEGVE